MTGADSPARGELRLSLGGGHFRVSAMSALLRVLQAAVRESARMESSSRRLFDDPVSAPSLYMSVPASEEDGLAVSFAFRTPDGTALDPDVVSGAFDAFMAGLGSRLKRLPQPGLWGRTVSGVRRDADATAFAKRMDQVHAELRRFPRSVLSTRGRKIRVEGDQIEISQD